ncbi:alpha/beta fold hydrolase [Yoonia sp. R2331]|uniref:alpha/beta fold hydrolase n=1 Tax=Yoonia sp. R2331 TaxID=3237238 RepID=UPI0034E4F3AC
MFDPFLDVLGIAKANRRYIELDRPNAEDFRDVFESVTPETVVCGFSLGAIVAAHAAGQMMPYSLILFGLNPFPDPPERAPGRHVLCDDVQRLGGAAALATQNLEFHGPTSDTARTAVLAMADQTADLIAPQTQLALTRPGALPQLAKCAAPVLCLTGSCDATAPPAQGRAAADHAPHGQFYELNKLGHFALIEDPDACAKAVREMHKALHEHV